MRLIRHRPIQEVAGSLEPAFRWSSDHRRSSAATQDGSRRLSTPAQVSGGSLRGSSGAAARTATIDGPELGAGAPRGRQRSSQDAPGAVAAAPGISRRPSSATMSCAARGVTPSSSAIMPAEASARQDELHQSGQPGRRAAAFELAFEGAWREQPAIAVFHPASAPAAIPARKAVSRVVPSRERRLSRGTQFQRGIHATEMRPGFLARPSVAAPTSAEPARAGAADRFPRSPTGWPRPQRRFGLRRGGGAPPGLDSRPPPNRDHR